METLWASKSMNEAALQGLTNKNIGTWLDGSKENRWVYFELMGGSCRKKETLRIEHFIRNAWSSIPIIIENQQLFKMQWFRIKSGIKYLCVAVVASN